jgi:Spy/CpxP family protein refolding chaperone
MKKRTGFKLAAAFAVSMLPLSVASQEVNDVPSLTPEEFVMNLKVRNLSDCQLETERLMDLATMIYRDGMGKDPDPEEMEANRTRRNAQCAADAGVTPKQALEFGDQLKEKYGDQLPQVLLKYAPKAMPKAI